MSLVALIATVVALFSHDPHSNAPQPARHYLGGLVHGSSWVGEKIAAARAQQEGGKSLAHQEQYIAQESARIANNSLQLLEQFIGKLESSKSNIESSNYQFSSAILQEARRIAGLIEREIDTYGKLISVAEQRTGSFTHNAFLATSINRNHRQLIQQFKEIDGVSMPLFILHKIIPELVRVEQGHKNAQGLLTYIDTAINNAHNTMETFRAIQANIAGAEQRTATVETHQKTS